MQYFNLSYPNVLNLNQTDAKVDVTPILLNLMQFAYLKVEFDWINTKINSYRYDLYD